MKRRISSQLWVMTTCSSESVALPLNQLSYSGFAGTAEESAE